MTDRKENYIKSPIEEGIQRYLEESQNYPKHGLICLVFPELAEEIEEILEEKLNTLVFVDV